MFHSKRIWLFFVALLAVVLAASSTSATEMNRLLLDQPEPQMSKVPSFDPNPDSLLGTFGYYAPGCYLGNCDPCSLNPVACHEDCKAECARGYWKCINDSKKTPAQCKIYRNVCLEGC